jgi:two-component system, chemotaxis family, sensor kinase CheA
LARFGLCLGAGVSDARDDFAGRARDEFFAEATELVESFGKHLLALEESVRNFGAPDPETLNDIFRSIHTLKGLSSLFGAASLSGLSHELENLLDDLRLGRLAISAVVFDLLFDAVELYGRILAALRGEGAEPRDDVAELLAALVSLSNTRAGVPAGIAEYDLSPETLAVLTEYEEHRLRANLEGGLFLYRLRGKFALATIDTALEDLKSRVRSVAEIITSLPTGDGTDLDAIDLEILLASRVSRNELAQLLESSSILLVIEEVEKRDLSRVRTPPAPRVVAGGSIAASEAPRVAPPTAPPPAPTGELVELSELASEPPSLYPPRHAQTGAVAPLPGRDVTVRLTSQTVRVDIRKLDRLMNALGELSIVRGALLRQAERAQRNPATRELGRELRSIHRAFEHRLEQLQDEVLEVRMVPLLQVFDRLARAVRQVSRDQGKTVNFVVTGGETEIDKLIVEELSDPLLHIIRNSLDHGIESAVERLALGKPEHGTIALNAYQRGDRVVIEVEDDGRGIDTSVVRRRALEMKIITPSEAETFSSSEVLALVFSPGFSTRGEVTSLSGRGIGMDVVKNNMTKLGGLIDLQSEMQIGTSITLTLPVTLAIMGVLTFQVSDSIYCVPLASIEEALAHVSVQSRMVEGREIIAHRGAALPILRLRQYFAESEVSSRQQHKEYLVVVRAGQKRFGLVVDALLDQNDVVVKPLGRAFASVKGFAGATDLGENRLALILDIPVLLEHLLVNHGEATIGALGALRQAGEAS